ncbi:MAG: hypothetical protein V7K57_09525 [Nostoc sp.]
MRPYYVVSSIVENQRSRSLILFTVCVVAYAECLLVSNLLSHIA